MNAPNFYAIDDGSAMKALYDVFSSPFRLPVSDATTHDLMHFNLKGKYHAANPLQFNRNAGWAPLRRYPFPPVNRTMSPYPDTFFETAPSHSDRLNTSNLDILQGRSV